LFSDAKDFGKIPVVLPHMGAPNTDRVG